MQESTTSPKLEFRTKNNDIKATQDQGYSIKLSRDKDLDNSDQRRRSYDDKEGNEKRPKNLDKFLDRSSTAYNKLSTSLYKNTKRSHSRYPKTKKFQSTNSNFVHFRKNALTLPSGLQFEPDNSRRSNDFRPNMENRNAPRITPRNNFRYPYENFKPRSRKRPYNFRGNFDRQTDRKYYKSKFNYQYGSRTKPFDYKGGQPNGFKAPKHLSSNQQRKRHLKNLRKTAADLASKDNENFVYKPGMIGLLRPNTPFNSTNFLKKDKKLSPKFDESNENDEKECFSVCEQKYHMTQYKWNVGSRTPEPKIEPLNLSNYEAFKPSHYSDVDEYYGVDDYISGTMEGLIKDDIFDTDPVIPENTKKEPSENRSTKEDESVHKIVLDVVEDYQTSDWAWGYKAKYESADERIVVLERILRFKNDYISQLEQKHNIK
jgi:hypothetical protein